jgi:uncharacterized protein
MKMAPVFRSRTARLPILLLVGLLFLIQAAPARGEFPKPVGAVNDFAHIIGPEEARQIDALSREVLEKTGASVVVATVASLEGNEVADYVNRLYQAWGIGKQGEDRGVLIFLALKERKIRIETGYGVEGILPDGRVGEILDRRVVPLLRTGDYGKGLLNAALAVSEVIARDAGVTLTGSPAPAPPPGARHRKGIDALTLLVLFLILIPLLGTRQGRAMLPWILLLLMSGSGGRGGGGFGGFGGGGYGGFGGGGSGGGGAGRSF